MVKTDLISESVEEAIRVTTVRVMWLGYPSNLARETLS